MKPSHAVEKIRKWLRVSGERGQTMAEYGILLGLISAAIVLAMSTIGATTAGFMTSFVTLGFTP